VGIGVGVGVGVALGLQRIANVPLAHRSSKPLSRMRGTQDRSASAQRLHTSPSRRTAVSTQRSSTGRGVGVGPGHGATSARAGAIVPRRTKAPRRSEVLVCVIARRVPRPGVGWAA
jgi:hypothetical protein